MQSLLDQVIDNTNIFHIICTEWEDEQYKIADYFPRAFVVKVNKDDDIINFYKNKYCNIYIDPTNQYKKIEHIIIGFYMKNKSIETINEYCNNKGIIFDLIVSLRTDTTIYHNKKIDYNNIILNGLDKVYIPNEYNWNIYNKGACMNTLVIANLNNTKLILDQLKYLDKCTVTENNYHHPETSYYLYLIYLHPCQRHLW